MTQQQPCPGGAEAHEAHLDLNGECPHCGASVGIESDDPADWPVFLVDL